MRFESTAVGLSWSPKVDRLIRGDRHIADFVEVPFERLRANPGTLDELDGIPVVLHCASMSIGGDIGPSIETIAAIRDVAISVDTPWIGEHLAFTAAHRFDDRGEEILNADYTICPQLSESVLEIASRNFAVLSEEFDRELILENPPQYFFVPGSTMSQGEFIRKLSEKTGARLLLDLAHLYITAKNTGEDPIELLESYPTDRVREIHISGASDERGIHWDNHATAATEHIFELLEVCLRKTRPSAITLEYNWHSEFEDEMLYRHIQRVRQLL